jgi:release factor glutamine methyltransferase
MGITDNLSDRAAAQADAATIGALLEQGRRRLAPRGTAARLEAELLLAHLLDTARSTLIAHPERAVPAAGADAYDGLLARAAAGEPLAYLTGVREFWSLPLVVTPAVLIPRPETELAVERCLALLASEPVAPAHARASAPVPVPVCVCDLGTGSGAIALALGGERPSWRITATDRSAPALQVAQTNARRLGRTIEFLQGDWFTPLQDRRFDLLVSNPPYVAAADPAMSSLAYEPPEALTPGPGGLEALDTIIMQAPDHLAAGGWLVLEHGADQGGPVAHALVARGFARVRCHPDLAGHDRVTEARWR